MATVYWTNKVRHKGYHNEPYKFDIHDWRLLREGRIYLKRFNRKEFGVLISAHDHIRFLPHTTICDVMSMNNKGRKGNIEQYHIGVHGTGHCITYCLRCHGAGKFDWIQKITPERRPNMIQGQQMFERDESTYYMYPDTEYLIFSKAKLNPGEEHCILCNGIGLEVDGRHTLYKGMKGIKHKLYPVEAEGYNEKLKLKGLLK